MASDEPEVTRADRFIKTAVEILGETGRTDFTVQEVVARSRRRCAPFISISAAKMSYCWRSSTGPLRTRLRCGAPRRTDWTARRPSSSSSTASVNSPNPALRTASTGP